MAQRKIVDVAGDVLAVEWNGNVWVAPTSGSQHSRASDAMRLEIVAYLRASGEDVADYDDEQVANYLSTMTDGD